MTQNRLSTASDVYSYAIIMYEMLTWQMPFHDLSKEQVGHNTTCSISTSKQQHQDHLTS
jgi:serine/threonine protein kinase